MNKINKFLLAGDKFMPEMRLRQFTKSKKRIQKFKETGDLRYIYQSKLDKAFKKTCFMEIQLKHLILLKI